MFDEYEKHSQEMETAVEKLLDESNLTIIPEKDGAFRYTAEIAEDNGVIFKRIDDSVPANSELVATVNGDGALTLRAPGGLHWISASCDLPKADETVMIAVTPNMQDTLDVLRSRLGAYTASNAEVIVFALVEFARRLTMLS